MRVYRYSPSTLLDVVREKVDRLANPEVFSTFPSLQRGLESAALADEASKLEWEKREELTSRNCRPMNFELITADDDGYHQSCE
jgi:hypothetical protein